MATRYRSVKYDTHLYGDSGPIITRSYILAQAIDYHTVRVTLDAPGRVGEQFLLLRTNSGTAEDPTDGYVVAGGAVSAGSMEFTDELNAPEAQGYNLPSTGPSGTAYYTVFGLNTDGTWFKDAATSVIIPTNKNTTRKIIDLLPTMYTSEDENPFSPTNYDSDLYRFLYGFSLTYDEMSSMIDLILPENRSGRTTRRLSDLFATGAGMPSEYLIGVAANARLQREAGYVYRNKGTAQGIATFAEALTGWQTTVTESTNLFLSLDDGSFEYSVGNWSWNAAQMSLSTHAIDGTVTGPTMTYESEDYPFSRLNVGRVTLSSTSTTMSLPANNNRLKCIPVTAGEHYYWAVPVKKVTGTPTVTPSVAWLDQFGSTLSTSTLSATTTTSSWGTAGGSVTAPTGACFAVLKLTFGGSSGNALDIDMMSFNVGTTRADYRDPRSLTVVCQPNRLNLVKNPSFDVNTTGWTCQRGTLTRSTAASLYGTASALFTSSSVSGSKRVETDYYVPVVPGLTYTLSGYVKGDGTHNWEVDSLIYWYDAAGNPISQDDGDNITLSSAWQRVSVTATAPAGATQADLWPWRSVSSQTDSGATVHLDGVLFERVDEPQLFFCGDVADVDAQDGRWTGTVGESYSVLYNNAPVKMGRLKSTLPYYLPVGVTARVLLWDSSEPEVQAQIPNGI